MIKKFLVFLIFLVFLTGCATTHYDVVYRDLPSGYVAVKEETLKRLVDELIMTRYQLLECWEKLRR